MLSSILYFKIRAFMLGVLVEYFFELLQISALFPVVWSLQTKGLHDQWMGLPGKRRGKAALVWTCENKGLFGKFLEDKASKKMKKKKVLKTRGLQELQNWISRTGLSVENQPVLVITRDVWKSRKKVAIEFINITLKFHVIVLYCNL